MLKQVAVPPSFLRLTTSPLNDCATFCLSIHSSNTLVLLHPLASVSCTAMNIGVQVTESLCSTFWGYIPRSRIADLLRIHQKATLFYILTSCMDEISSCSMSSPTFL
jgi:hypothetical protein